MKTIQHFVNGKSFSGESKRTGKIFNPATGEQSAEVKLATTKDTNEAVASAKKVFESWSNTPPLQRARVMFKFKDLIEKNIDELTKITKTKFIIITHHALTMSRMHRLYGVTMAEQGVSQLVAVDLQKAEDLVA